MIFYLFIRILSKRILIICSSIVFIIDDYYILIKTYTIIIEILYIYIQKNMPMIDRPNAYCIILYYIKYTNS